MKNNTSNFHNIRFKTLFSEEMISARVKELGLQIANDYVERNPIFVCILRGGIYFFSDLTKAVPIPIELDFMQAKSYVGTESSGNIELIKDLDSDISGRDVLIVEDIVDTGRTLKFLISHILSKKPKSLEVAALLFKEGGEAVGYPIKYIGWKIGKEFVIGYGLDYDGKFRNLPGVFLYSEE
ncbi:hypoxanthine phosphoribosyltransferase [Leptospira hartskeerlii]|uniref:Hypoxanthine phosphoribosyltransferase n=1 Tax=Leptospira hartskeerlii TaxID=2023177 RepID=A0A2M9XHC6_9LEPT|nr:hypoxanthine phosphoribosyltransferase [Leptospira hartskeerlii]PJZ27073.1 hypoxanthine phosphoribosyltransferase [Leptospira hartskeerlii]PJZ33732.1 hypoxanthine phosphoribosyltransferase [Leptospira hartskeerlii]